MKVEIKVIFNRGLYSDFQNLYSIDESDNSQPQHSEELTATDIIKALAKSGQTLKIQTNDGYDNTEFEITT